MKTVIAARAKAMRTEKRSGNEGHWENLEDWASGGDPQITEGSDEILREIEDLFEDEE